jgi:predicted metal-dependent hydrolase
MSEPTSQGWQPLEEAVTKDLFKAEVQAWTRKIGVEPKEVHVRAMRHKWGSCSTAGRVTFDAELLAQPADFRRQVIVHELLHLKVPNHGRVFRALLRAYLGEVADQGGDITSKPARRSRTDGEASKAAAERSRKRA